MRSGISALFVLNFHTLMHPSTEAVGKKITNKYHILWYVYCISCIILSRQLIAKYHIKYIPIVIVYIHILSYNIDIKYMCVPVANSKPLGATEMSHISFECPRSWSLIVYKQVVGRVFFFICGVRFDSYHII